MYTMINKQFFTMFTSPPFHMETSPLPMKGYKMTCSRHSWPLNRKGFFRAPYTYHDSGLPYLRLPPRTFTSVAECLAVEWPGFLFERLLSRPVLDSGTPAYEANGLTTH